MANRKKVVIKAREVTDVEVDFLSLVKRGANRIPYRLVKSEDNDMAIDLSKIFFRKSEPKTPVIGAVAVASGDNQAAIIEALKKSYDVVEVVEHEDAHIVKFDEDFSADDADVVKMSDDIAAFVMHLEKGVVTYPDSESFMENMQGAGFLPSVRMASDVMLETIMNVVWSEGDQATTIAKIESVLDEYREYVTSMVGGMPMQLFKMESDEFRDSVVELKKGLLNSQEQKEKDKRPDAEPQTKGTSSEEEKAAAAAAKEGEEGAAPEGTEGTENASTEGSEGGDSAGEVGSVEGLDDDNTGGDAGDAGDTGAAGESNSGPAGDEKVAANVQKSETDSTDDLLNKLGNLFDEKFKTVKSDLEKSLEGLDAKVGKLEEQVSETSKLAKSADEAVRGTVTNAAPEDTDTGVTNRRVVKGESEGGLFDNALKFPGFEA